MLLWSLWLEVYEAPTDAEKYQAFYENNFWQQKMAASGFATVERFDDARVDQLELRMPKYRSSYARLKRDLCDVMKLDSHTRVLEVGCAFGFSLEWLQRDYGCHVFGIEPSADARKRCQDAKCISLVAHTAEECFRDIQGTGASDQYDLIFFRHSLENMTDPQVDPQGCPRASDAVGNIARLYTQC